LVRDKEPKPVVIPKAFEEPKDSPPPPGAGKKPVVLDPPPAPPIVKVPPPVKPEPRADDIPDLQPVIKPEVPVPSQPIVVTPPKPKPVVPPQPKPEPIVKKAPVPSIPPAGQRGKIKFYGHELVFYYDPALAVGRTSLDNGGISDFWSRVSATEYQTLLDQLGQTRQHLVLNDWGFYQLLQQTCQFITGDQNDAVLLSWFMLNKAGFQAKMGYSANHAFLLVPSGNTVYEVPYYDIDGERFYNFTYIETGIKPGEIKTYRRPYPGADSKVAFGLLQSPQLPTSIKKRDLDFSYRGKKYAVPVSMNLNAIEFYRAYPSTDMQIFFSARVDAESAASLIEGLRPIIAGKKDAEAANMLLRFVQTAFEYKTDDDQFGGEKYMFAAETLYYPYSDCEDRAILYSYLVRELLQLEVVGLIYPGHAATAVRFNQPISGDQVEINGARYLVCDPTYINADIGTAMPQFKKSKPTVIAIY
jgi:hypothetical protein